jgi:hypothetical protein
VTDVIGELGTIDSIQFPIHNPIKKYLGRNSGEQENTVLRRQGPLCEVWGPYTPSQALPALAFLVAFINLYKPREPQSWPEILSASVQRNTRCEWLNSLALSQIPSLTFRSLRPSLPVATADLAAWAINQGYTGFHADR